MRVKAMVALLLLVGLCSAISDPPRGWFSLSDPEYGFSFNYPGDFRLSPSGDLKFRSLEQREQKAQISFEVIKISEKQTAEAFATAEQAKADEGSFKLVESKPLWCIVTYKQGEMDVCKKALEGSRFAYLLTITFRRETDPKKAAANASTALRIAKSLRRLG